MLDKKKLMGYIMLGLILLSAVGVAFADVVVPYNQASEYPIAKPQPDDFYGNSTYTNYSFYGNYSLFANQSTYLVPPSHTDGAIIFLSDDGVSTYTSVFRYDEGVVEDLDTLYVPNIIVEQGEVGGGGGTLTTYGMNTFHDDLAVAGASIFSGISRFDSLLDANAKADFGGNVTFSGGTTVFFYSLIPSHFRDVNATRINVTIINATNISADYFIGNGSLLTGIESGIWTDNSGTAYFDGPINVTQGADITGDIYSNGTLTFGVHDNISHCVENNGQGSIVMGRTRHFDIFPPAGIIQSGFIESSGVNSFAGGISNGMIFGFTGINSSGNASFVWGHTGTGAYNITGKGQGSLTGGFMSAGNQLNEGNGCFMWGLGNQYCSQGGGVNLGSGNILNTTSNAGVTIGASNTVSSAYGVALGYANNVKTRARFASVALGSNNDLNADYTVALGYDNEISSNSHSFSYLIGKSMISSGSQQVRLGINNRGITINRTSIYMNTTLTLQPNGTGVTCNSGSAGMLYYDGGLNKHRGCNGTDWRDLY